MKGRHASGMAALLNALNAHKKEHQNKMNTDEHYIK
jgi:hypothetical protein